MSYALNEVEALAKKAARGAGYTWGLAEEAGKATRFLCANGLDGCAALLGVLDVVDGCPCEPEFTTEWRAKAGMLCPVTLGAALSDRAGTSDGTPVVCSNVIQPTFVLAPAALIARVTGRVVTFVAGAATGTTDGVRVAIVGRMPDFAETVTLSFGGTLIHRLPSTTRARPEAEVWRKLNAFAHRTYAPATEESRRKGAG